MQLILGDCLEKMKELPDNSVDTIITDPPYGLKFMGKKWDYDVPSVDIWKECLRVLKPGGYLLSFAGTRTQHRMAVNIEDAGFEIRDMIAWVYGSGFPKSMNIGKSIEAKELTGSSNKTAFKYLDGKKTKVALGYNKNNKQGYFRPNDYNGRETTVDHILHTKNAKQWEGWGTALKPALEPITVARKPLEKGLNVASNCLKWGTGGINIDGSRVPTSDKYNYPNGAGGNSFSVGEEPDGKRTEPVESNNLGRFPANLIHDGSDEVRECFPETKQPSFRKGDRVSNNDGIVPWNKGRGTGREVKGAGFTDTGNASRFFYCAKASKAERNIGCEGLEEKPKVFNGQSDKPSEDMKDVEKRFTTLPVANFHPTVKPLALMEYLVKLVSREGQVVLDPFMGSGTTGMACVNTGRDFIGIEIDEDYFKIAQARIESCKESRQLTFE